MINFFTLLLMFCMTISGCTAKNLVEGANTKQLEPPPQVVSSPKTSLLSIASVVNNTSIFVNDKELMATEIELPIGIHKVNYKNGNNSRTVDIRLSEGIPTQVTINPVNDTLLIEPFISQWFKPPPRNIDFINSIKPDSGYHEEKMVFYLPDGNPADESFIIYDNKTKLYQPLKEKNLYAASPSLKIFVYWEDDSSRYHITQKGATTYFNSLRSESMFPAFIPGPFLEDESGLVFYDNRPDSMEFRLVMLSEDKTITAKIKKTPDTMVEPFTFYGNALIATEFNPGRSSLVSFNLTSKERKVLLEGAGIVPVKKIGRSLFYIQRGANGGLYSLDLITNQIKKHKSIANLASLILYNEDSLLYSTNDGLLFYNGYSVGQLPKAYENTEKRLAFFRGVFLNDKAAIINIDQDKRTFLFYVISNS